MTGSPPQTSALWTRTVATERRPPRGPPLLCVLLVALAGTLSAQESSDCLMCHEDSELTTQRKGRKISLYVNPGRFASSVPRRPREWKGAIV